MGRTNPTYRRWLDHYETEWGSFRRALRHDRQADFDRLFERANAHAAAAGAQNATQPEFAFVLSVLLSHERALQELADG